MSREVRSLLGIDLDGYKPHQVWRRATSFARRNGLAGAAELGAALKGDAALLSAFRDLLTINVSEFFRDPDAWVELGRLVEPILVTGRPIRAWSAGCSFGFEPYSIAMMAREATPSPALRILATDIDETALARTRAGRFSHLEVGQLSANRRRRHLVPADGGWVVHPDVRRLIEVRAHDLIADAPSGRFDLIVCRNVLIYLTEASKTRLYTAFAAALRPGGVLFVGATELVPRPAEHGLRSVGRCLYVKA
jgi:chemotaxis protein methyltransferase CheR